MENAQEEQIHKEKRGTYMNPVTEMKTNPNSAPESIGAGGEQGTAINYNNCEHGKDLEHGSTATPFSTLAWALLKDDLVTVAAQLADDIEWDMMPNMQKIKGKNNVIDFLKAGKDASAKEPVPLLNIATKDSGVWEYINRGTVTKDMHVLAAADSDFQLGAKDMSTLAGQQYAVAVCFVYQINAKGKIYLVHEYLDLENLKKQFK
jgi:limonene-1,2-epoxide hydrolase